MDVWAKAESGIGLDGDRGTSSSSSTNEREDASSSTILMVGDAGCGKSSLIQAFLKPNATKEPKTTFALEYCFARRKNANAGIASAGAGAVLNASAGDKPGKTAVSQSLAHIWELGGDIYEPKLLNIALSAGTLPSAAVIVCIDLSKPQDCYLSLKRWMTVVREHLAARCAELRARAGAGVGRAAVDMQAQAQAMRESSMAAYSTVTTASGAHTPHPDTSIARPSEVPIFVVANKNDVFRNKFSSSDRRTLLQVLRFVAHYHGASLIVTSAAESSGKETFRLLMNHACFGVPLKPACDVAVDHALFVTAGRDSFAAILTGKGTGKGGDEDGKSILAVSESDVAAYVTPAGVNKESWTRFETMLANLYGVPDPDAGRGKVISVGGAGATVENGSGGAGSIVEYPEQDVDEARSGRDLALEQYIQDAVRREKMAARSAMPEDEDDVVGGGGQNPATAPYTMQSGVKGGPGGTRKVQQDDESEFDDRRRARK